MICTSLEALVVRGAPFYFEYSRHATRDAAEDALASYFAEGIICEGERPKIERVRRGKRPWLVMFPG
jgi:hypothetical protein